eukprot:TRINITY_DN56517_c0_g1_i1.p1 TRINITY_DN56517_c0_g1~~TRINITY_DN56517_c0_g1_i1.p1  ORF type:complete len:860 (-),score=142.33 TRINITY_DN56517_c0_g1_i1:48-2627(-)
MALTWLWEDRPEETVPPAPGATRVKGAPARPTSAWQELVGAVGEHLQVIAPQACRSPPQQIRAPQERMRVAKSRVTVPSPVPTTTCSPSSTAPTRNGGAAKIRRGSGGHETQSKLGNNYRPASRLTLANFDGSLPQGTDALWRGIGLLKSLRRRQQHTTELAEIRGESRKKFMAQDRSRAAAWFRDKMAREKEPYRCEDKADGVEDDLLQALGDFAPGHKVDRSSVTVGNLASKRIRFADSTTTIGSPTQPRRPTIRSSTTVTSEDLSNNSDGISSSESTSGDDLGGGDSGTCVSHTDTSKKCESNGERVQGHGTEASADTAKETQAELQPKLTPTMSSESSVRKIGRGDSVSLKFEIGHCPLQNRRMMVLLQARQREFDRRPSAERTRLREAFASGDIRGEARLDTRGVRIALKELGLIGNTQEEKAAVIDVVRVCTVICDELNFYDFINVLLPKIEHKLQELRSPDLYSEFVSLDVANAGRIRTQQVVKILTARALAPRFIDAETLEKFWSSYQEELPALFAHQQDIHDTRGLDAINFLAFRELVVDLEERRTQFCNQVERDAASKAGLTPSMEEAHFGETAFLLRIFLGADQCAEPRKVKHDVIHTLAALVNAGIVGTSGEGFRRARALLQQHEESSSVNFIKLLHLVERLRDEQRVSVTNGLATIIECNETEPRGKHRSENQVPMFHADDLPSLLKALDLCIDCHHDENEMKSLIEAYLSNLDQWFDATLAVQLLMQIAEKARIASRQRESRIAARLGLAVDEVMSLRMTFASLSQRGYVGVSETKALLKGLSPNATFADEDIEAFFAEIIAGNTSPTNASSPTDEKPRAPMSNRALLRFDGFLHLATIVSTALL